MIEKFGASVVAIYKVTTLETQRKTPSVTRLKGRRSRFIIGLISISVTDNAMAPSARFWRFPPKSIPPILVPMNQRAKK